MSNLITVRIETDRRNQKKTDTVWFEPQNIEACIQKVEQLKIEHIHLQTETFEFLNDSRLKHIKGIFVQYKMKDASILKSFKHLTHLTLPEGVTSLVDFGDFPNLIFLGGRMPKKYVNFEKLTQLKFTYLFSYRKKDFSEFENCLQLEDLEVYSLNCKTLVGLSNLSKLNSIKLEKAPKLTTLKGIGKSNPNVKEFRIYNAKNLVDVSLLSELKNLNHLYLSKIHCLDSIQFLSELDNLEFLFLHPNTTGVKYDDYYPLVEKFQKMNNIEQIRSWKKLDDYLSNKVKINSVDLKQDSPLQKILKNLSIKNWTEKDEEYGMKQYTPENCNKVIRIFEKLINHLENKNLLLNEKILLIKESVLQLNELDKNIDDGFIETGEREELCDIFDNIAEEVGINVQDYNDDITLQWREW